MMRMQVEYAHKDRNGNDDTRSDDSTDERGEEKGCNPSTRAAKLKRLVAPSNFV